MGRAYEDAIALIGLLCERFPNAFTMFQKKRRPLKIGIKADIAAALGDAAEPQVLGLALRIYTGNVFYRMAQKQGAPRIDLDGNEAGAVSEADALNAAKTIAGLKRQYRQVKSKAAAASEPPAPPAPVKKPLGLSELREAAARRKA